MTRPDKTPPPAPHRGDPLVEGGRGIDVRPPVNLVPSELPPMGPSAPLDAAPRDAAPTNQGDGGNPAPSQPAGDSG